MMAPERIVADESQGEDAAGEESVGFRCGGWGGWVVVRGLGEKV